MFKFDNSYAQLGEKFFQRVSPSAAKSPELIGFNNELAAELGIEIEDKNLITSIFSGKELLSGSEPLAMAYAGHQFGHFVPQLGDGRAILLGEIITHNGTRYDIQLKGSGQTAFSRRGDGRSSLGPVIREYLVSEAMHSLGIPTTRALAAVTSGETVHRETSSPGGIITRVARGHIRVGTFEYFACRQDQDSIQKLADYCINRFYPELNEEDDRYFSFFKSVAQAKLSLVANWMRIGFIHGVMNTDNTSISGETIDFGPCAFMDQFEDNKVFSSIDRNSRYAYNQQGNIALWNLSSLANCLIPLIDSDQKKAVARLEETMPELQSFFNGQWLKQMGLKFGFENVDESDTTLINDTLKYFEDEHKDFTLSFRDLDSSLSSDLKQKWKSALERKDISEKNAIECMNRNNPSLIPRNHQIENAIKESNEGSYHLFNQLNQALKDPYGANENWEQFKRPPRDEEIVHQTFCGT